MTRAVTAGELTKIRSDGHWSRVFLATLNPKTIYTAVLDTAPTSYDMVAEITYVSGSGTLADVKEGMSLYVGTTAGDWDLGIVRIRKAPTANTFYIGEQSKVNWGDAPYDVHLTVVEDFDLWAKHIHMNGTIPLMDYDIAYSDQHSDFNPVPVLGSHRVAKLTGSTVDVNLGCDTANGESSWVYDSSITTYLWEIPDATAIDNTGIANPVATFDSVGFHACYCTVTAANGKSKTGMRWVYIWDDDNLPAEVFQISGWEEDFESGGVVCNVEMNDDVDLTEIRERSLCIMFSVDYYDGEEVSIGQVTDAENIRMVGRVGDEGIEYSPELGRVGLEIQSYQYWFSKIPGFPVGVEISTNTPDAWTNIPALTVDRGLWHLLEWRSTAIAIMDFFPSGDSRYSPEVSAYTGNLWGQMQEFITQQILGYVAVDPLGRLHAGIDPQIISESDRASDIVTVMTLQDDDILPGFQIDKQIVSDTSLVDVSGIQVDQYGGSVLTYFALSPGSVFGEFGSVEIADRLLLESQSRCNELAGLLYGWKSNKYKELSMTLVGNNPMIGCFPGQYVAYTVPSTSSPRGEEVSANFIPRRRSLSFDNESGAWEIQIDLEAESFEENAVQYVPPAGDSINIPPLPPLPPLPDFPPLFPGSVEEDEAPPVVAILDTTYGILYSTNFNAIQPTWHFGNTGIPAAEIPNIYDFKMTPNGAVWVVAQSSGGSRGDRVYRAPALGALFEVVIDDSWFVDNYPSSVGVESVRGLGVNPYVPEEVCIVAGYSDFGLFLSEVNVWLGNADSLVKGVAITSDEYYGGLTFGGGAWIHANEKFQFSGIWNNRVWRISADGSAIEKETAISSLSALVPFLTQAGASSRFFITGSDFQTSADNGDTITTPTATGLNDASPVACDYTGQFVLGVWGAGQRGKSSDYGETFTGLPQLPFAGAYTFCYAGGIGVKSHWIAARSYVRFSSTAFGAEFWSAKEGNLAYLIPLGMIIIKVVVPGVF
jgi:hypothetical protein